MNASEDLDASEEVNSDDDSNNDAEQRIYEDEEARYMSFSILFYFTYLS